MNLWGSNNISLDGEHMIESRRDELMISIKYRGTKRKAKTPNPSKLRDWKCLEQCVFLWGISTCPNSAWEEILTSLKYSPISVCLNTTIPVGSNFLVSPADLAVTPNPCHCQSLARVRLRILFLPKVCRSSSRQRHPGAQVYPP